MTDAKTLRVATLNIWNRFGPWEDRLRAIRAGVCALAPDLLGLQEVVRLAEGDGDGLDQASAIAEGFGYHTAYSRAHDEQWFGNAILSRWPIAESRAYELPRGGTEEREQDEEVERAAYNSYLESLRVEEESRQARKAQ